MPRRHPALQTLQLCLSPVTSALSCRLDKTIMGRNLPCTSQLPPSEPCRLSTVLCARQGEVVGGTSPDPRSKVTPRHVSLEVASQLHGQCNANRTVTGLHPALIPPVSEPWGCHLWCRLDDEAEALRYHQESHRVYPVDMEVISWLGAFHVKNEVRNHLQRAELMLRQPVCPPWQGCIGRAVRLYSKSSKLQ